MTFSLSVEQAERKAASQARRDFKKLAAAQAEIAALAYRVEELERSPSRRALEPARWLFKKFQGLHRRQDVVDVSTLLAPKPIATSRGLALVIDHSWPQPDRDSGSVDIVNMVRALEALGFDAILAASKQHSGDQPLRDRLIEQGVPCLSSSDSGSLEAFIRRHGSRLVLGVMCRVFCGGEYLELLQSEAPQARLVFNSIDLNFLREERRARLLGDHELLATIEQIRPREEHVISSSDVTLVVSQTELELLAETMPDAFAVHMPLARRTRQPATNFQQRIKRHQEPIQGRH